MHNFLELENGVAAPVRGMQMEWRDYHKCSQTILRNKPLQPCCSSASPQFQLSLHSGFPKQKAEPGTVKDLLAVQKEGEIGLVLFKLSRCKRGGQGERQNMEYFPFLVGKAKRKRGGNANFPCGPPWQIPKELQELKVMQVEGFFLPEDTAYV